MGTCGHVGLSALVTDNDCNSEDHLAASRADLDGGGQVGQRELDRHRVVTARWGTLGGISEALEKTLQWPCPSSWRGVCSVLASAAHTLQGARDTGLTHTHTLDRCSGGCLHHNHLPVYLKCRFLGSTPDQLHQKLWKVGQRNPQFKQIPKWSS